MQSKNKIWFLLGMGSTVLVGVTAYLTSYLYHFPNQNTAASEVISSSDTKLSSCNFKRINVQGYKFVKPILLLETDCEAADLYPLKNQLEGIISNFQSKEIISNASVFVFDMNRSEWTGVNDDVQFQPGSLIKVPLAISVMKKIEEKKIKLTEKIVASSTLNIHQTYSSNTIEAGKTYTIEELLKYSLAYSDNGATQLLNNYIDLTQFKKVFTDLAIAEPNVSDLNYTISAKDYSKFIRVLYNGGYIHRQHSELILKLMNESSFKDGILASLGEGAMASTKFGESKKGDMHQIHETGIVYVNNTAYLITIMTEGKDVAKLPEVIKIISKNVFDKMSNINNNATVAKL
jgi:beta-lactamase class A